MSSIPFPRSVARATARVFALTALFAVAPGFLPDLPGLPGVAVAYAAEGDSASSGVVNVNTATAEELALLPGIGESKARAILAAREERGRFQSLEELLEVKGIGERALERMRPHLALKGRTTLAEE